MGLRGPLSSHFCLQTAHFGLFKRPDGERTQFNIGYLLFAFFAIVIVQQWCSRRRPSSVPYSEFEAPRGGQDLRGGGFRNRITGKLKAPENGKTVAAANLVQPDLAERLSKFNVKYTRVQESTFLRDCCRG